MTMYWLGKVLGFFFQKITISGPQLEHSRSHNLLLPWGSADSRNREQQWQWGQGTELQCDKTRGQSCSVTRHLFCQWPTWGNPPSLIPHPAYLQLLISPCLWFSLSWCDHHSFRCSACGSKNEWKPSVKKLLYFVNAENCLSFNKLH